MDSNTDRIAAAAMGVLHAGGTWTGLTPICRQICDTLGRKRLSEAFVHQVCDELNGLVAEGVLLGRTDAADLPEYMVRERFFEGKRFLIKLTPFEREKGLLVVGHRFAPFVHPDVPLGNVEMLFEGKVLARQQTRMTAADSMVYCTLLGKLGWIGHLVEVNSQDAAVAALASKDSLLLPTIDLGPVLQRHPGASGFLVECKSYRDGVVQVVGVRDPTAPVDFRGMAAACQALDAAFAVVFDEWEPESISIPEQIALAYARMPESYFAEPPFHFGGYLELTKAVALAMGFMDSTLWRQGEDPKNALDRDERDEIEGMIDAFQATPEQATDDPEPARRGRPARGGGKAGARPGRTPGRSSGSATHIYTLDVALDGQKHIRRRIEVHEENTWEDLHEAIFDAFDRDDEHLYAFYLTFTASPSKPKRRRAPVIGPDLPSEGLSRDRDAGCTLIGDDTLNPKDKLYYLFDFGDEWWHEITVVSVEGRPGAEAADYPRVVGSKGDSPPQYPLLDEEE